MEKVIRKIKTCSTGYQGIIYTINNLKIKFLNTAYKDESDSSLILLMVMLQKQDKYDLSDIDYLKVGHCGSKKSTSSNLVDVVNPKYSIISVSKNNLYNHLNNEVLANLSNTKIYRTNDNGSILKIIV